MLIPDYHLHSCFSDDCNSSIEDIINMSKQKGLTSICITDHYDIDFPTTTPCPYIFNLDVDSYINKLSSYKSDDFDLRIGIELGVMPTTSDKLNSFYNKYKNKLDFIIASTHIVDNMDPYYPEYFQDKSEKESILQYFETVLDSINNFHKFSVYGHLDYILRYCPSKEKNFIITDYYDIIKEIFTIIINNGCGIELNTGSLYRGLDFPHPHIDILKMYKNLGGEIITFGSDAHKTNYIGFDFEKQRQYLKSLGFKYFTTYKKLNPSFHNL